MKTKILLLALIIVCFLLGNLIPVRAMWQPSIAVLLFVLAQRWFTKPSLTWAISYAIVLGIMPMIIFFAVLLSNDGFSVSDALAGSIGFFDYPFIVAIWLLVPILVAVVGWWLSVKLFREVSES